MKHVFNFKLYLEGLKKVKLVGIIIGIVTVVLNALIPLVNLMNVTQYEYMNDLSVNVLDASEFSVPLILIIFLTPFFFFSMFSFLNKRNESDFYHAIPYKRGCVLGSFVCAIYTWIFAIIVVATFAAAILWWVNPTTTFSFSLIPLTIGVNMASAIYIGGFILLAMTLSGTIVSNIAVAIIALFSFRVLGALITVTLEELVPMFDIAYSFGKVFSFRYWLPTAVISSFYDNAVFSDAFLWIYSAVVTVGIYALASFSYCKRKSESAGRSAPARKLQHVYRILFTLPFALLTTMAIIIDGGEDAVIIFAILTLLVYYLYELITVKNIKSALRSTPLLLIVLACCIVFSVGCVGVAKNVHQNDYDKDDIETIRFYNYASILDFLDSDWNQYEYMITNKVKVPDEAAREIVANALKYTIDYEQGYTDRDYSISMTRENVEIELKSGNSIGRRLYFTMDEYKELMQVIQASAEYKAAFITLPDSKSIERINVTYVDEMSDEDEMRLWNSFTKEYNALSDDEKLRFKQQYTDSNGYESEVYFDDGSFPISISVYGTMNSSEYYAQYAIPESFTETRKVYFELVKDHQALVKDQITEFTSGKYNEIEMTDLGELSWADIYLDLYVDGTYYNHVCYWYTEDMYAANVFANAKEVYGLLLPYLTNEISGDDYCMLSFNAQGDNDYTYNQAVFGLKEMSKEEKLTLINAVGGYYLNEEYQSALDELNGFVDGMHDSYFSDYKNTKFTLNFTFEDQYYEISNQSLGDEWNETVTYAKEALSLITPFLTEEVSNDQVFDLYIAYSTDEWSIYESRYTFGWACDDEDAATKIEELLSQLQSTTIE